MKNSFSIAVFVHDKKLLGSLKSILSVSSKNILIKWLISWFVAFIYDFTLNIFVISFF